MSVASMTGFGRAGGEAGGRRWGWEIKSVNARTLDIRCRVPAGAEHLEAAIRARLAAKLSRGAVTVQLSLERGAGATRLVVNRALLDELLALHGTLGESVDAAPPRLEGLLAVRGVVEEVAEAEDPEAAAAREVAMLADLGCAIDALAAARAEEGAALAASLAARLDEIDSLHAEAEVRAAARPAALMERLEAQLADLLGATPPVTEERLAQELALLVTKADVCEELDRLSAHAVAARRLLAEGGAIGRRLDFLCQEFNREANTLCAKAGEVALTEIGLRLKAVIDQLREQAQNIE